MEYKVLFKSEKSDFVKLAFFTIVGDFNKLVIVSTKEKLDEQKMLDISNFLIDFKIVKDEFAIFNIYITDKQIALFDKMGKK